MPHAAVEAALENSGSRFAARRAIAFLDRQLRKPGDALLQQAVLHEHLRFHHRQRIVSTSARPRSPVPECSRLGRAAVTLRSRVLRSSLDMDFLRSSQNGRIVGDINRDRGDAATGAENVRSIWGDINASASL